MIAVRQMGAANIVATDIKERLPHLREHVNILRRAGLHDAADQLETALDDMTGVASALDAACRETFVALRQGKPVPS